MRYTILIITLIFASCASKKTSNDVIWDEKFELCSEIELSKRIKFDLVKGANETSAKNIYPLFENFLLEQEILKDISIEGYKDLMYKTFFDKIDTEVFRKFSMEIEFEPFFLFTTPNLYCYAYPYPNREDQLRKLKKGWQYEFCLSVNKLEAEGGYSQKNINLIYNSLDKIPEEKFSKEVYRRFYLNIVYRTLN